MTFITEAYMFSSGFLVGASMMGVASVLLGVLAYVGVRRWREHRKMEARQERERQHTQNLRAECERLMRDKKVQENTYAMGNVLLSGKEIWLRIENAKDEKEAAEKLIEEMKKEAA